MDDQKRCAIVRMIKFKIKVNEAEQISDINGMGNI